MQPLCALAIAIINDPVRNYSYNNAEEGTLSTYGNSTIELFTIGNLKNSDNEINFHMLIVYLMICTKEARNLDTPVHNQAMTIIILGYRIKNSA